MKRKLIITAFAVLVCISAAAGTPRELRRYLRDSLDAVEARCAKVLKAAYMADKCLETKRNVPGYEGYPVKLYEYHTGKDVVLGESKRALVYLLNPDARRLAKWIVYAAWDCRGEVRYEDVEKILRHILYQSGAQFPVKGVVYEAMYQPGLYEPYVFKDGITVYIKDGPMKAIDNNCTDEQLQFYLDMDNDALKDYTGRYARICSTTREMYYAAGGTDEVGTSEDGKRSLAWMDTIRKLYLKAWRSERNFLIYAWAKANL